MQASIDTRLGLLRVAGAKPVLRTNMGRFAKGSAKPLNGGRKKGAKNKLLTTRANLRREWKLRKAGVTPLEHFLGILRDPHEANMRRDWAAVQAAPYCHPRLNAIAHQANVTHSFVAQMPADVIDVEEWQQIYSPKAVNE